MLTGSITLSGSQYSNHCITKSGMSFQLIVNNGSETFELTDYLSYRNINEYSQSVKLIVNNPGHDFIKFIKFEESITKISISLKEPQVFYFNSKSYPTIEAIQSFDYAIDDNIVIFTLHKILLLSTGTLDFTHHL